MLFAGCYNSSKKGKVHFEKNNGRYTLYKNNKPFIIKGASGFDHLDVLSAVGGNTIRIWDTVNIDHVLQQANKYHLSVIVGLPMPQSYFPQFYDDTVKVNQRFRSIKAFVNKHKNNPAILMWCVGNELSFRLELDSRKFYRAFNDIVAMIHHDDPDHPVTTTLGGFRPGEMFNLNTFTDVDVISNNIFGEIKDFIKRYKYYKWTWNGPYLLTEWGVSGPWEETKTAWEAPIEPTSNTKAEIVLQRYKMLMDLDDPKYVGAFIFYWGQKQETTPTWFSLFDETGAKTEVINTAEYIWTGKAAKHMPPQIRAILVNQKKGEDNVFVAPDSHVDAEVVMEKPSSAITHIQWKIFKEDWFKRNNVDNVIPLPPLLNYNAGPAGFKLGFKAPKKEGPYRVMAYVYDKHGYVATCNIPFYVLEDPK